MTACRYSGVSLSFQAGTDQVAVRWNTVSADACCAYRSGVIELRLLPVVNSGAVESLRLPRPRLRGTADVNRLRKAHAGVVCP